MIIGYFNFFSCSLKLFQISSVPGNFSHLFPGDPTTRNSQSSAAVSLCLPTVSLGFCRSSCLYMQSYLNFGLLTWPPGQDSILDLEMHLNTAKRLDLNYSHHKKKWWSHDVMEILANATMAIIVPYKNHQVSMLYTLNLHIMCQTYFNYQKSFSI